MSRRLSGTAEIKAASAKPARSVVSALTPKADNGWCQSNVRFVPIADMPNNSGQVT
jgi:hypothetical protein